MLRALPGETLVYCGHEYTSNARFARAIDLENAALKRRAEAVEAARAKGFRPCPVAWRRSATNPFLRADDPQLAAAVGAGRRAAGPGLRRNPPPQGQFLKEGHDR